MSDDAPVVGPPVAQHIGVDPAQVAAAALGRARAAARARGFRPGQKAPARGTPPSDLRSSARADGRDPALVGETLARLAAERGWERDISVGSVQGRWAEIVGAQVAEHCVPETFDDGVLVVRADSSSWAANLRLLAPQLLDRLAEEVGEGVVADVRVVGPAAPRWGRGPRRVPGRGPRDTYG